MTASDEWLSPQAAILSPAATLRIAAAIVAESTPYRQTIAAGRAAQDLLKEGIEADKLHLSRKEQQWLTRMDDELDSLPKDEEKLMHDLERNMEKSTIRPVTTYSLGSLRMNYAL